LITTVHPGIIKLPGKCVNFRKEHKTPIETGFHLFYDQFLKLNQQKEDGIELQQIREFDGELL
jgi:hypothetical protein